MDGAPGSHGRPRRQVLQPRDHGPSVRQAAYEGYPMVHGYVPNEAREGRGVLDEGFRGVHIRDSAREVGRLPPSAGYRVLVEPRGAVRGCIQGAQGEGYEHLGQIFISQMA